MMISILFLLVILIITLDSIGSKRMRRLIIHKARTFFEESKEQEVRNIPDLPGLDRFLSQSGQKNAETIQTLRFKLKGAQKDTTQKILQPVEAKQFHTLEPLTMSYYEDRTLGFLWSMKKSRLIFKQKAYVQQRRLSLFSYGDKERKVQERLSWMHLAASMPWIPDLALLMSWSAQDENTIQAKLLIDDYFVKTSWKLAPNGQVISCRCTMSKVLGSTFSESVFYEYFDFAEEENWRVPLRIKITEKYKNTTLEKEFIITQVVYNEGFAWW